ncbi:hypothetical protein PUN28_003825 [Cardiocondyla obscurior]|uniref:Uncharacterized protein n=1 Tax=Cardiocondyla obscurior TaxID=286306 RepID=A0AAW2GMX2_9HYME
MTDAQGICHSVTLCSSLCSRTIDCLDIAERARSRRRQTRHGQRRERKEKKKKKSSVASSSNRRRSLHSH